MAEHAELAGVALARSSGVGIDLRPELQAFEADSMDDCLPPCARQGTGNSTGPEIDIPLGSLGHLPFDAYVTDLNATSRPQHPEHLPVGLHLVGHQIEDPVGDDQIGPAIDDMQVLGEAFPKSEVVEFQPGGKLGFTLHTPVIGFSRWPDMIVITWDLILIRGGQGVPPALAIP